MYLAKMQQNDSFFKMFLNWFSICVIWFDKTKPVDLIVWQLPLLKISTF